MNARCFLAAATVATALMLAGCGADRHAAPPLAGAAIGGPFRLIDQDGRPASDREFAGRWRIMYFGYTFCPDICPTTLQTLMKARAAFDAAHPELAARLVPIFVSVDPARDTPAVMKQYVAAFGPGLIGLTGGDAAIAAVAREYAVSYQREAGTVASGYLVQHSSLPMLFDPDGKPIALLPTDAGAAAVTAELERWIA